MKNYELLSYFLKSYKYKRKSRKPNIIFEIYNFLLSNFYCFAKIINKDNNISILLNINKNVILKIFSVKLITI